MKKLYKYSDWFNIWKLIVVTEKNKRNDSGRFDFSEFSNEILNSINCNLDTHIQIEYEEKIKEKFLKKLKKDDINQDIDLYDIMNHNINNMDNFFNNLGKEIIRALDSNLYEYLENIEEEEYTKELIIDGISII